MVQVLRMFGALDVFGRVLLVSVVQLISSMSGSFLFFFFSSRRRHTRYWRDWSSDVCSSDLFKPFLFRYAVFHPGSRFESNPLLSFALHDFHLADMRIGEVDAEIPKRTVFGMKQRKRQHPPVENELRPLSVEREVLQAFNRQTDFLRIRLVVVGDVIFAHRRSLFMEMIAAGRKTQHDTVARPILRLYLVQQLANHRSGISLAVGFQPVTGRLIHTFFGLHATAENHTKKKKEN